MKQSSLIKNFTIDSDVFEYCSTWVTPNKLNKIAKKQENNLNFF